MLMGSRRGSALSMTALASVLVAGCATGGILERSELDGDAGPTPIVERDGRAETLDGSVAGDGGAVAENDGEVASIDGGPDVRPMTDGGRPSFDGGSGVRDGGSTGRDPIEVRAVDVSVWTRTLLDYDVDCLWDLGYRHVIAGTQDPEVTRQQLEIAVRGGMTVDLYVYLYWTVSVPEQVRDALAMAAEFPEVGRIWLDVEESPAGRSAATLSGLIEEGLRALDGFPGGIYTRASWWNENLGGTTRFADIPLWYARYDARDTLEAWDDAVDPDRFGGWERPTGKQYADHHVHTCGLAVDRNAFLVDREPTVALDRATPADDGDPPPAPTGLWPDFGLRIDTDYVRPTAPTIREATGYEIEIGYLRSGSWLTYLTLELAHSGYTFFPVASVRGAAFRWRLRARNAHGWGPWSAWATFTVGG